MITVTNSEDTAKISVIGQIGESWFDDGFTLQSLKDSLGGGDYSNIELEIMSMGGDLIQALAIYDALRASPAKVKAKIVGSTASAGTVIAMAADEVEITENSNFLIHRAKTMAAGNSEDMDAAAEALAGFDEQLLNIYQKKTGKRKSQISNLMKEDKWIKPAEAIEWGFVDKITKTKKPILNQSDMDLTNIKTILNVADDTGVEDAIKVLQAENERLTGIVNQIEADKAAAELAEHTQFIENAVTDGKITAETKDHYLAIPFENAKALIEAAKPAPLVQNIIPGIQPDPEMSKPEAQKIWDVYKVKNQLGKWQSEKPEEYAKIRNIIKQ